MVQKMAITYKLPLSSSFKGQCSSVKIENVCPNSNRHTHTQTDKLTRQNYSSIRLTDRQTDIQKDKLDKNVRSSV